MRTFQLIFTRGQAEHSVKGAEVRHSSYKIYELTICLGYIVRSMHVCACMYVSRDIRVYRVYSPRVIETQPTERCDILMKGPGFESVSCGPPPPNFTSEGFTCSMWSLQANLLPRFCDSV